MGTPLHDAKAHLVKAAAALAPALERLLKLKTRAQYQTTSMAKTSGAWNVPFGVARANTERPPEDRRPRGQGQTHIAAKQDVSTPER